jgi:hypothetical protein
MNNLPFLEIPDYTYHLFAKLGLEFLSGQLCFLYRPLSLGGASGQMGRNMQVLVD